MTAVTIPHETAPPRLPAWWTTQRPLIAAALGGLLLLAIAAVGLALDPRTITGAPAWMKPAKFALSTALYAVTMAWILRHIDGHRRLVSLIGWGTATVFALELALIVLQVVRGVRSHFNFVTPLDAALFSAMGAAITFALVLNVLAAVLMIRQRFADPVLAVSLRFGLVITAIGAGVAFLMTQPTPDQLAALQTGAAPVEIGAHSVGVGDGGPGLPIVGWSTTGGDLRIPHFVGLHALQVLPLLGLLLSRIGTALSQRRRVALTWIGGVSYLILVGLLTWQALRGQPLLAPDAATVTALAFWLGGTLLSAAVAVAWPHAPQGDRA
ncbi:MAG: hypothetical protein JNL73_09955 [Anaerolineales bacterium]|nr:hypothetical protein [Anaerolineales bacterium]